MRAPLFFQFHDENGSQEQYVKSENGPNVPTDMKESSLYKIDKYLKKKDHKKEKRSLTIVVKPEYSFQKRSK